MKKTIGIAILGIIMLAGVSLLSSQSNRENSQVDRVVIFDFLPLDVNEDVAYDVTDYIIENFEGMDNVELVTFDELEAVLNVIQPLDQPEDSSSSNDDPLTGEPKKKIFPVSVHPFDSDEFAAAIGKELDADYMLTGAIQKKSQGVDIFGKVINLHSAQVKRPATIRVSNESQVAGKNAAFLEELKSSLDQLRRIQQQDLNSLVELRRKIDDTRATLDQNMKYIPGGNFQMGAEDLTDWDAPPHSVYVRNFYMDIYEVRNWEYATFLTDAAPSINQVEKYIAIYDGFTRIKQLGQGKYIPNSEVDYAKPVVNVSWYGAEAFCEWAGKELPSEAEWEYAAGGPNRYKYAYANEFQPQNVRWNSGTIADARYGGPNDFGLFNMIGNVYEWCTDWFRADYYTMTGFENPQGPTKEQFSEEEFAPYFVHKSLRGGAFNTQERHELRIERRWWYTPDTQRNYVGFRCVRRR
jgi:formylglycine-generating enzyme